MLKNEELTNHESCINSARMFEMTFVLLGRDAAAATAVRAWCNARIAMGKNVLSDPQIMEALACAERMERESAIHERMKQLTRAGNFDTAYDVLLEFYREEAVRMGKLEPRGWLAMCLDAKLAIDKIKREARER